MAQPEVWRRRYIDANAELIRVRSALPRTPDGATVLPGMTLWIAAPDGVHPVTVDRVGVDVLSYLDHRFTGIPVDCHPREPQWSATFADRAAAERHMAGVRGDAGPQSRGG